MKKRFLAFLIVIPSLLASCQNDRGNGPSSGQVCSVNWSFDDREESDLSIKTLMGRDFTRYMCIEGTEYSAVDYYGCFNGYYAASYTISAWKEMEVSGRKNWMMIQDNFYDEVCITDPELGYGYRVPHYLWKDREIVTITDAFRKGDIEMGDILAMAFISRAIPYEVDIDFPLPDPSEIEILYKDMQKTSKPIKNGQTENATTLREKICLEFAKRHGSFIDRYLECLDDSTKESESKKPKTWVENYFGSIGDAHVLEMGLLGYSELPGFDANIDNLLYHRIIGKNGKREEESFAIRYPLVIYKDGKFYGFSATFAAGSYGYQNGSQIILGEPCPLALDALQAWQDQVAFDDSVLDVPLS